MSPRARRAAVNQRLTAGFLAGLTATLRELFVLLDDDSEDARETLNFELDRIWSTAESLGLDRIVSATGAVSSNIGTKMPRTAVLAPLVRALHTESPFNAFAPIALIGDRKVIASVEAQDDGTCEPILGFADVDALRDSVGVDWPQAILLPSDQFLEVDELAKLFDADIYLYGASRDTTGRLAGTRSGARGFVGEPLALPEILSHIRYVAQDRMHQRGVALVGPAEWSTPLVEPLENAGLLVHTSDDFKTVPSILHGTYPEALVLGPGQTRLHVQSIKLARQHNGRSHVALLAVGDPEALYRVGVDDVLAEDDDVVARVRARMDRFRDHRRDRDDLTHLLNRAGVLELIQRYCAWSERANEPLSIALVLAEGLSAAAEQHGREASNACRRHLAAALERGLRRVDIVGHLGGDLFISCLVRCEAAGAVKRMTQIRETFEARIHADRRLREVSLSIGVADSLASTRGVMTRAQTALDQARTSGRT